MERMKIKDAQGFIIGSRLSDARDLLVQENMRI